VAQEQRAQQRRDVQPVRICVRENADLVIAQPVELVGARIDAERDQLLKKIENSKETKAKPVVTRFKGLGEMNPSQLRETTMDPRTRRLVQLTIAAKDDSDQLMDMLLAKKRASDRKDWLEEKGNLAEVIP